MNLSVIVCTYQRSAHLKDVLECLLRQDIPQGFSYEILIVDNNSKDSTSEVVHSFIKKFDGKLRYLFEGRQGLQFARNAGVRAGKGDVIVFTDDDVLLDPGWLKEIQKIFKDRKVVAAAGKILALWNGNKPSWYSEKLCTAVPDIDHGELVKPVEMATGANMAFRREVIVNVGLFEDTPAEDSMLSLKINKKHIIWYFPSLKVYHKVFPERMTPSYFRNWYFKAGRSIAIISRKGEVKNRKLLRVPIWMYQALLKDFIVFLWNIGDERTRFWFELQLRKFMGFIRYEWIGR